MTDQQEERSAFARHLGIALTEWREDYARFEAEVEAFMGNRHGIPHGGVHATMLDTAMGHAGCFREEGVLPLGALTLSLNVQYIGQVQGTRLIAEGWRTGGGKSTFFAEARLSDDTGMVLSRGTGVFRYRKGHRG